MQTHRRQNGRFVFVMGNTLYKLLEHSYLINSFQRIMNDISLLFNDNEYYLPTILLMLKCLIQ